MESSSTETRSRRIPLRALAMGVMLGVALVIVAVILLLKLTATEQPPDLTAERLDAASESWRTQGLRNYQMTVTFSSRETGTFRVQVADGEVTSLERDGVVPRQHTWADYSVDGLLEIMRLELQFAEEPDRYFGASPNAEVVLQAEFHPELGYPLRYRRAVMGVDQEVAWRIDDFRVP